METTKIIQLAKSITIDGKEYTAIHLREPIVNEVITSFKKMGNKNKITSAYEAQIDLVAKVSGLSIKTLEEFPTRILDEAIEYITSFQKSDTIDIPYDEWGMEIIPPLQLADGDQVDELFLKEPTVKQRKMAMKQFDQYEQSVIAGLEFQVSLLMQVTDQKMAIILKLPISQFMKASTYLMRFFPDGQIIG